MIAHLQGKLVEKSPTQIIIDCGGVGYHVNISLHTYSLLPNTDFIKVYTHLQIKRMHTLWIYGKVRARFLDFYIGFWNRSQYRSNHAFIIRSKTNYQCHSLC
jgi:hypothetical protein